MKKVIYIILCMLLLSSAYAVTSSINSFYGQTNPFNISFSGKDNHTFYLSIPNYIYNRNISLSLTQFNFNQTIGFLKTWLEYRETGIVWSSFRDDDWNTYSEGNGVTIWYNYTIPIEYDNLLWVVKDQSGLEIFNLTYNYTDCLLGNKFQARTASITGPDRVQWACYNYSSASFIIIRSLSSGKRAFEEELRFTNGSIKGQLYISGTEQLNNGKEILINITPQSLDISLNISIIHNILNDDCNCLGCSISGTDCLIPFTFYFQTNGTLQINLTNATYSYGIDNCTNSLKIPSNSTALNISFYNIITNTSVTVNTTLEITGFSSYDNTEYQVTDIQTCVYPAWYNRSHTVKVKYWYGAEYVYYTFDTYLNSIKQNIPLYIQAVANIVTFTVKEEGTETKIPNVLGTMYRKLSGVWTVVSSKYTDITGVIKFNYEENVQYKFFFSKVGYQDYIFYLDPITSTSYDLPLTRLLIINKSMDFDRVGVAYYPEHFKEGSNNFTFMIQSPYSELISYRFNLTYPSSKTSDSGNNPIGESFDKTFTITNPNYYDFVILDYCFTTALTGQRCFKHQFDIQVNRNTTLLNNQDQKYGLGIFERALVMTLIVILIVGVGSLVGQPLPSAALALIVMGFLVKIGFIELWLILLPVLVGFFMIALSSRSA